MAAPTRTRIRTVRAAAIVSVCAVLLAACSRPPEETQPPAPDLTSITGAPAEFLTVIPDAGAAAGAIAVSAELYESADVVVTAPELDLGAQLLASSAAVRLGSPLLLTGSRPGRDAVAAEIDRLGAQLILNVSTAADSAPDDVEGAAPSSSPADTDAPRIVNVAATPEGISRALASLPAGSIDPPAETAPPEALAAVAALNPGSAGLLTLSADSTTPPDSPAPSGSPGADGPDADLAGATRARPLDGAVVLAIDDPAHIAGVATARAAGVEVLVVPADSANPQSSAELITALEASDPAAVLTLGAAFQSESSLEWKVRSAVTGAQLPGGGQLLFPRHILVALYGHPGTPALGVLGEQGDAETLERARQTAAPFAALTDRTVVPTLEIIATVASADAGADGNYSNEVPAETLRPLVEAAGAAGIHVVLDLQPGRTDFLTQAKLYESLLVLPHVGLALDPEWRLLPDQVHLRQIGSVPAAEVNQVVAWLADLTAENALPQKLLVLHQFQLRMVAERNTVDMSRDELAILIHVDGQGSQPAKQDTWRALQVDAPAGVSWGWKNFYDEDSPTLSPEQTMTEVLPTPDLVTYQ